MSLGEQFFLSSSKWPPRPHAMISPQNSSRDKPFYGLWTSSIDRIGEDSWLDYVATEFTDWKDRKANYAYGLTPWADAKILEIDSIEAHDAFILRYRELFKDLGTFKMYSYDWEQVRADGYHGVHLSIPFNPIVRLGISLTRWGAPDPLADDDMLRPTPFYGWDCESTIWLRWAFWGVRRIDLDELIAKTRTWEEQIDEVE